ncbi:MAG TPA: DUF2007 domain-containing protein [Flavobacterium sp.]|jgi:hypothetical protein|uniref:DUF2007 domain-containing protein n=2 Tax=Flavobacterium TaxID=237 RepID=A0ABY4KHR2_9FLAO|nr:MULTISPECIES: DUF2007 domain-containing protein [Flavobacterium]PKP14878.1 MAG: hypothetical protein CVU07_12620 [Bacteroidetes bacterium HGW-Bacteroidetes-23]RAR46878.1 putative signal transducing protein [Flavobacterium lacus]UPQ79318.1 DUF2007 domain-containing protein [Flavobacterium azooxidireducens]HRE79266.1 DUF2007 domain-containing protein [Flavobacterium sp.]
MGMMKIFSGSQILASALKEKIEEIGVEVLQKDNIQSARLGGFGNLDLAVELFIDEKYYGKVTEVVEKFRMSI